MNKQVMYFNLAPAHRLEGVNRVGVGLPDLHLRKNMATEPKEITALKSQLDTLIQTYMDIYADDESQKKISKFEDEINNTIIKSKPPTGIMMLVISALLLQVVNHAMTEWARMPDPMTNLN
jgi:hypothetical protein